MLIRDVVPMKDDPADSSSTLSSTGDTTLARYTAKGVALQTKTGGRQVSTRHATMKRRKETKKKKKLSLLTEGWKKPSKRVSNLEAPPAPPPAPPLSLGCCRVAGSGTSREKSRYSSRRRLE